MTVPLVCLKSGLVLQVRAERCWQVWPGYWQSPCFYPTEWDFHLVEMPISHHKESDFGAGPWAPEKCLRPTVVPQSRPLAKASTPWQIVQIASQKIHVWDLCEFAVGLWPFDGFLVRSWDLFLDYLEHFKGNPPCLMSPCLPEAVSRHDRMLLVSNLKKDKNTLQHSTRSLLHMKLQEHAFFTWNS